MARQEIGEFIEVFVDAPLSELVKRDVKGLYKRQLQVKLNLLLELMILMSVQIMLIWY